ncbi:hypothetical protein PsorP6_000700 [Peronosclerospora sorghi]|uniref:Uncharacterized protein n=1 Tax=Peronosclerospora sorghi TaxID=230839 RepID=A0ACC0WYT5_9STRA|nr:hypothetical protein PsorP6_000700 [Peronosclerospora sorghi]
MPFYDKFEWVTVANKELTVADVVADCILLHYRAFNFQFLSEYRNRTFGKWSLRYAAAGNSERWAIEELRLHFGERVVFFFAFMHIYTKHLVTRVLPRVSFHVVDARVAVVLARPRAPRPRRRGESSFLVCWARESRLLVEKWHLAKYQYIVYERNDENPGFQYVWVKNHMTHEMEKIPRQRQHQWIQLTMFVFVLVCAVIQCLCLVPFIQRAHPHATRAMATLTTRSRACSSSRALTSRHRRSGGTDGSTLSSRAFSSAFSLSLNSSTGCRRSLSSGRITRASRSTRIVDPVLEYLDACFQFSYVMMFTVVWPLLDVPAFFNNILEVQGDAFRLRCANRRPMPRRDTSMGEWATVLAYANIIGVTVVSTPSSKDTNTTKPRACVNESGERRWILFEIVLFVVLEHVGFLDTTPAVIRSSVYQRLKQIQHLTATKAVSPAQLAYVERLRVVFDTYDRDGDGHVVDAEIVQVVAAWVCKHPSKLLPYAGLIFRYMDKPKIGKVPFSTCCLMMQFLNQ